MQCPLVIGISQYGHCEEWRNIIINIINTSHHFANNAHDAKYICTEDITTLQHCLVLCDVKFLCSWIYHQCFRRTHVYKRIKRCYKYLNVSSDNNIIEQYESVLLQPVFWKLSSKFKTLAAVCKSYNPKLKVFSIIILFTWVVLFGYECLAS